MNLRFLSTQPETKSRSEWREELNIISEQIFNLNNPYHLNNNEKENANLVLHALAFILDEMDIIKQYINYCHSLLDGLISIHFNFHTHDAALYNVDLETYLIGIFIKPFVNNYYKLKALDNSHIKAFLSKLQGTCLEIKLESAFLYADNFKATASFSEQLEIIRSNLDANQQTYHYLLAEIMKKLWGQRFAPDKGKNAIVKDCGTFDINHLELIDHYLRNYLNLFPTYDYLVAYKNVPSAILPDYFQFIFSQQELQKPTTEITTNDSQYLVIYDLFVKFKDEFTANNFNLLIELAAKKKIPITIFAQFKAQTIPEKMRTTLMSNNTDFVARCALIHASIPDPMKAKSYCWIAFYVFKTVGPLSAEQSHILNSYLRSNGLTANIDFLMIYSKLKPSFKEQYYQFIFSQPEFTQKNILNFKEFTSDNYEAEEQYEKMEPLADQAYSEFFSKEFLSLLIITQAQLRDPVFVNNFNINARNFILNAPSETLASMWCSNNFMKVLYQPSIFHRRLIIQAIFDRLSKPMSKLDLIEVANAHLPNGQTLLHYVAQFNDAKFLAQFLRYFITIPEINTDTPNANKLSTLLYSAQRGHLKCVPELFATNALVAQKKAAEYKELSKEDAEYFALYNKPDADNDTKVALENRQLVINAREKSYKQWIYTRQQDLGITAAFVCQHAKTKKDWQLMFSLLDADAALNLHSDFCNLLHVATHRSDIPLKVFKKIVSYYLSVNIEYAGETAINIAVKSGNTDKVLTLLAHRSIKCDIKDIKLATKYNHKEIYSVLELDRLIEIVYFNKFQHKVDLGFLKDINQDLFRRVYQNFLKRVDINAANIERTRFIFTELFFHLGKNIDEKLAFYNHKGPQTTALFKWVRKSNVKDCYAWQGEIRRQAFTDLLDSVDKVQAPEAKLALLTEARNTEIFALHRSRFWLFALGRTNTQIQIDDKIIALRR